MRPPMHPSLTVQDDRANQPTAVCRPSCHSGAPAPQSFPTLSAVRLSYCWPGPMGNTGCAQVVTVGGDGGGGWWRRGRHRVRLLRSAISTSSSSSPGVTNLRGDWWRILAREKGFSPPSLGTLRSSLSLRKTGEGNLLWPLRGVCVTRCQPLRSGHDPVATIPSWPMGGYEYVTH